MWEVHCAEAGSKESQKYMADGFEPFSVTTREKIEAVIWFRKQGGSDASLIAEAKREERNRIIGWLEGQQDLLSGASLSDWTDELVEKLKALPPFI